MDLHYNKPRQEIFFRADGTPYMNKWLRVDPVSRTSSVERITMLDAQGAPYEVLLSNVELIQSYLDRLIGDDHTFLSVESRRSDGETLTYLRPNVKHVYVLHNPHIAPPFDDLSNVRASYKPMLDARDEHAAVVFLTNAQRADAEAVYGEHDNFFVIPHPVRAGAARVPSRTATPTSSSMLARLDAQKRIPHAIASFAHVVKARPQSRLEIYGPGPRRRARCSSRSTTWACAAASPSPATRRTRPRSTGGRPARCSPAASRASGSCCSRASARAARSSATTSSTARPTSWPTA